MAVRGPSGTQLDVPIPKAVSPAPLELTIYAALNSDGMTWCVCIHLLLGPEQPGKVPDLSEKHQRTHRRPAP